MSNGYGAQPGVPRYPSAAREAQIPIVSNAQCSAQYGYGQILPDMLCAGSPVSTRHPRVQPSRLRPALASSHRVHTTTPCRARSASTRL